MILSSNSEQSSRFMPPNNHKYVKGLRRKKTLSVNQPRLPMTHQLKKPNLQEARKNEDGACFIPTIVNGVTNVNLNQKIEPKCSDSIGNRINKLRETINVYNKKKCSLTKEIKYYELVTDIKGYVCNLKLLLSSNYDLTSVVKPGSSTSELKESTKEEVSQLSHDDLIVIGSGTNDYELNEISLTLQNINFIKSNSHTSIILINVPFRYDLPNSVSVNKNISILNRKLQKLLNFFPVSVS